MFFSKSCIFLYLIVETFANLDPSSPATETVQAQNYRKIDFPLNVWNQISSEKTEEVTIVNDKLNSGTIECGVACQIKSECGGFVYNKTSGSCSMKWVRKLSSPSPNPNT